MSNQPQACRLCGEAVEGRAGLTFGRFALSRCGACGFEQIAPEPRSDELDALYNALYFQKAKYNDPKAIELEYQRRHRLFARANLKPGDRILEVGCGAGQFIATCADTYDWHGMDYSPAGIEEAKSRLPELPEGRLIAGPIESYVPQDAGDGFDAVVIFDTIEHIYWPKQIFEKSAAWLKPGGRLILSTPDIGAVMARVTGKRWPFMTPPEHLSFFTQASMRQALGDVGLETSFARSWGKFANLAFVIYKAGRVGLAPKAFGRWASAMGLGKVTLYVPTGDVMYIIAEKPADQR